MAQTDGPPDIRYSIRIFPIEEDLARRLEIEFASLAPARRFLPKKDGWNLVLEIGADADVQSVIHALRSEGLEGCFDLFISLVPSSDSLIRQVPNEVVRIVREFGCPVLISY